MITKLFPQRPSFFREARLAYFADQGAEAPKNEEAEHVTLDTKMKIESADAIGKAKDVRIKAAEDATTQIEDDAKGKMKTIADLELKELTKGNDAPTDDDLQKAAQTVQDRFAHADIYAQFTVDPATKEVTWTFEPLEVRASDFHNSIPAELRQKFMETANASGPSGELAMKEFFKDCTMEQLNKLKDITVDPSAQPSISRALNVINWSGDKASIDASVDAIPDPAQRTVVQQFRDAFGDKKIGTLQASMNRVADEKKEATVAGGAEEGQNSLPPAERAKLEKALKKDISKMKEYDVMRVQGQIMLDFGVNVSVEGEDENRKLVADPVGDEKTKQFTKFMGLVLVVMSYVTQFKEMTDPKAKKEKTKSSGEKAPDAGGDTPDDKPGEAPEVTAQKKGDEKLAAAGATKDADGHTLALPELNPAKFTFDAEWKVNGGEVKDVTFSDPAGATDVQKQSVEKLNAICKELADINKESSDRSTENTENKTIADDTERKIDKLVSPKVEAEMTKLGMKLPDELATAKEDVKALRKMLDDNKTGDAVDALADKVKQHGERADVMQKELVKQMGEKMVGDLSSSLYTVAKTADGFDLDVSSNLLNGWVNRDPDFAVRFDATKGEWEWKFTGATVQVQHDWTSADEVPDTMYDATKNAVKRLSEINKIVK